GSDAGGHRGLGHVKGTAQGAGQAAGAGAQLLVGAGQADCQSGEADGAVAGSGADVQRAGALKSARASAEGQVDDFAGAQANRGGIAEGVARFEQRRRAQGRAVGGRAGLSSEEEPIGGGRTDRNAAGVGGAEARGAESQGDVGGDVVREIGEGDQARDGAPVGGALES